MLQQLTRPFKTPVEPLLSAKPAPAPNWVTGTERAFPSSSETTYSAPLAAAALPAQATRGNAHSGGAAPRCRGSEGLKQPLHEPPSPSSA